jgi:hypothetical protein
MDKLEFVKDVTYKMCDHDFDLDPVESTYADDFVHHANGATSDKARYLARGRQYREQYKASTGRSSTSCSRPTTAWSPPTG